MCDGKVAEDGQEERCGYVTGLTAVQLLSS